MITENKVDKFQFTEIDRLLAQREQIRKNKDKPAEEEKVDDDSYASYFGLNAASNYFYGSSEEYKETECYKMLHRFYIESYVVGNN